MSKFSVRLREIRMKRGKTQAETAEYLGFKGLRGYQYYEEGKNEPNIARLIALAEFYHFSHDNLLGRSDPSKATSQFSNPSQRGILNNYHI